MPDIKLPNILVTGTPGVGKSHLCAKLSEDLKLKYHDISAVAKDQGFVDGHDEEYDCPILDEDKLLDYLEPIMSAGGNIVEYHSCDFFPERWFDAVFVVTCNNTILHDRLTERNYNPKKLQSNIECEIFQTILEEARDSYDEDIVFEIKGETEKDCQDSVKKVKEWYKSWKRRSN